MKCGAIRRVFGSKITFDPDIKIYKEIIRYEKEL